MCTSYLNYHDYNADLFNGLHSILASTEMSDVTLAVEGTYFKAHQLVLSMFSSYFRELFHVTPSKSTIFFMKNVKQRIMKNLLTFIYEGKVEIPSEDFQLFVDTAKELKIRGLTNIVKPDIQLKKVDVMQKSKADRIREVQPSKRPKPPEPVEQIIKKQKQNILIPVKSLEKTVVNNIKVKSNEISVQSTPEKEREAVSSAASLAKLASLHQATSTLIPETNAFELIVPDEFRHSDAGIKPAAKNDEPILVINCPPTINEKRVLRKVILKPQITTVDLDINDDDLLVKNEFIDIGHTEISGIESASNEAIEESIEIDLTSDDLMPAHSSLKEISLETIPQASIGEPVAIQMCLSNLTQKVTGLIWNDYRYTSKKECAGYTRWQCTAHVVHKCNVKLFWTDDGLITLNEEHNHEKGRIYQRISTNVVTRTLQAVPFNYLQKRITRTATRK